MKNQPNSEPAALKAPLGKRMGICFYHFKKHDWRLLSVEDFGTVLKVLISPVILLVGLILGIYAFIRGIFNLSTVEQYNKTLGFLKRKAEKYGAPKDLKKLEKLKLTTNEKPPEPPLDDAILSDEEMDAAAIHLVEQIRSKKPQN